MDNTTTPTGQADAGDEWSDPVRAKARYEGLQKVLNKRDADLAAAQRALDERTASIETDMAELASIRAQRAAEQAELQEQERYEALRVKYEEEPATPLQYNEYHPRGQGGDDGSAKALRDQLTARGVRFNKPEWP